MGTSTTITGLRADRDYRVHVRAVNVDGNGDYSSPSPFIRTNTPTPRVLTLIEVPADWPLKPDAVGTGGKFRLLFVTSQRYFVGNSTLGHLDSLVGVDATGGHADIQSHAGSFSALACSYNHSAIINTGTSPSDSSVSVYWLNGAKVADNYADLYDGSWDSNVPKYPNGTDAPRSGPGGRVAHGCQTSGRSHDNFYFGADEVIAGFPGSSGDELAGNEAPAALGNRRYYGLSGIFQVAAPINNAPVFSDAALTREVAENSPADVIVGAVIPAATDADNDTLTYSMEGAGAASFNFNVTTRQITTKSDVTYNYEGTPSYSVTIRADDGTSADTVEVTIDLADVDEPPDAPAAPEVTGTSGSTTSLDVSWTAPTNTGKPVILQYDLQYRVNGTTAWINGPQNVMGTSSTIATDLTANTLYDVQVRATNEEGDGDWSEAGAGSTNAPGNNPATGVPTVTGTARVGETLTAAITDIADADGLPDSFSYQWERVVGGTETDISGATSSTYDLVGADEGSTVRVKVSFTDDAGNAEGPLTSAATASVASPLLSVADANGTEGGSITFTATLSAASGKTVTATWTASVESGDTAASGDLTGTLTGTLTFAAGELTKTFTVATAEDMTDENDETFTVTLSSLSNATLTGGTATGTITDDDGAAALRIADASAAEGSAIAFTVTLVPASAQTVTVNYATSVATGDSATTGDFTATSGSLTFEPGDIEKTFTVATTGDAADEPDETFTVTLSGQTNATLGDATATGTIEDNDDPPTLSVADASAEEGNSVTFTATLSAASGQMVTATWTASSDTAASGDLTGTLSGSLTFAPGVLTKTFTVGTREDTIDEDDETFTVTLSNLSNATLTGGTATGTIDDDDEAPTMGVSDGSASEGEIVSFTATLSAASGKTVTVNWTASAESGDTAESSDLGNTRSGSLTFPPGTLTKTFTVGTDEDTTDEDNETFTVTLSGPSNATLSDATGRGTITDDDPAPTLGVADASASEGSEVSFTGTLSAASGKTVTATWTATRNSAESTDVTGALTGTLSFAPGDLTKTFTVDTTEDTTDEEDETFTVTLSGLSNATLTGGTATGTIVDDDDPPSVGVADARAEEGDNITFTATLSAASEKTVTVDWSASAESGDTAESGDLTGTLGARLTFAPGDLTKSFTVRAREDNVDEIAEETFTVTLSAPSNVTVSDVTAAGTIEDDDTTTLRVSGPASAVTEGGDAVFTVTLSTPNSRDIEAFYETQRVSNDAATHTKDYMPFGEGDAEAGTLAIAAGDTTVTVTVTTVDDVLDESATERFELVVQEPQAGGVDLDFTEAGANGASADIADNDPQPVVELVVDPASIGEDGGSARVTARMAGTVRSDRETVVTVLAAAVSPAVPGDFTLSGSALRIAAEAADSTGTVTVTAVDNDTDAPDKAVTVSATVDNERGATAPAEKTLPIADDDDSPTVELALSASSISEAGGTSVLTATLSHPSSEATTVTVTPQAGSFTLTPANGQLTIAAGATAGTGSVTLTAVDNRTDAPDNELTVTATAANMQGVYDDADGIELTITDEDAAPTPMLVLSQASIGEAGASATVRVTLTHPSSEATTVVVAAAGTVDRAAEFTLADATLTVPAGSEQSPGSATITATPNDTDAPDQVVTVSGTASNSQGIDGDPDAVELTIADDDAAPTVTLALATNPIAEESGSTAVTASLSHPSSEPTTVTVTAAAVAPTVAGDFAQSGSVLTIAAGDLESTGTVTVTAAPNFVDAVDRTVRVSAAAANAQGKAGDPANVNLTIADDDERGFTWSPETMNIEEAAAFRNYMVALTSQPTADMTVTIADPGGDLTFFDPVNLVVGTSMTLTFTPDNWSTAQEVGVGANHDSDSRNEQIDLRHTGAGGDYQGYRDTYRVVVSDDDRTAGKVVLTVDPSGVEEGGGERQVTVTASLDGARRTQATAVTVTAGPGSAEATDFAVSPASFTLTIPAAGTDLNGSERRTVTLTPANDDIDEDGETVRFSGTTTATVENSTTVLTVDPADVTIADDDARGVTVSETAVAADEGGRATWTVVLRSTPTGPVTVTPAVTGNSDVTVSPATLTFTAVNWEAPQTVTVEAGEDDDAAGDTATVAHTVAGADYGANGVTAGRVAVTVTDNDERTLALAPVSLRFDEGTSGTYTVALSAQPTGTVTVRPSVSDNPDVTVAPASLGFTPTTWETPQTVTVTARADANGLEDRATVRHAISGADYGSTGAVGPDVPVTVNDVATTQLIALSVSPASVPENGRRQTVRVTAQVVGAARDTATVVNVQVIGKTASPTDFTASPSALTVTIPTNLQEGSATFGLTGTADTLDEGAGETIEVRGTSPSGLDVEPAEVTIADDDGRGLTVSRTTLTVNEQGMASYTVRLTSQPTGPVTVTPAVRPGGSPDVRFTPASLAFTTADWSRAQTVTVTAADDADGDDDGATLRHTASGGDYGGIEGGEVVVAVRDNDQASRSVQLSVNPLVVGEDDGGRMVTVTATLDGAARAAATDVALAATGGTAVAVTDFAAVTGVTVTIPAQQLTGTATFRFSPVNDNLDEGLSETVILGGTVAGLTVRPATLTIADDDGKGIELSGGPVTLTEEGSATYTVVLATQPTGPVTVRVTVSGDRDVTVAPASLSFAPTTWETAQTVTVRAAHDDDAIDDGAELRHAATGADYGGVRALPLAVAVTDNDTRGVTVSETAVSFREGGSTTWTVVLDTRPSGTVRVTPAPATGSDADVTVTPSSLSFTATSWSRAQTVTVRAAHDLDKLADSATVEHAVSGADYGDNGVTANDVGVTVTDDDVPSTSIALSVSPATVREGASATRLTVTAELDASPEAAATEVTLSLAGLTATSGTDFQAVDPVTLTLPAGQVRATARITLTPVRDAIDEGDGETVRIGAVNASSGSALLLNPSSLEVTIADDDTRGITLSRSALTVREEGSATWTVRLMSAPEGGDVTVRPTVTGNPDVMVTPASLTFTAADWSRAQTVTVTAADDADGDNETAAVEHRVSGADYGANAVTVPDLPVSVNDNDQTSRSVQLSVDPSVVEEDGGGATVTVTATLDGAARAAATDVALAATGGTAVAVTDFAAVTGVTVTIPAQQLTGTATFRFSPVNDNLDEGLSETVVLGGSVTGLTVRPATLTIADDDGKGLELSQGPVTLTEEGSATYTVALATQPTGPVTVRVTVSGDRDVTVAPASLSFAPTTWETAQTVTVTAAHDDDAIDDGAELRHAATGADYGGVRALPLAVAVTDNDTRGVTVSETAVSFREGGSTTWTVVLDTRPSGTVRVTPAPATGSDADVTVTPSSLSFTATSWSRAQTVTVRAAHDLDKLADSATVEHAVSGADYGDNDVTANDVGVTVTDDDVPSTSIALSVSPATVREGASATRLTVTAELDASPEAAATEVTLSLAGLTATSGTDFQAVDPVTLTLPAGQVRATARITLTPVRDAIDEGDGETVRIGAVNASSGSALLLNPSSLEVTIADDDTRGITLSRSALTVREEGSATWTVRLKSAPEGGDVTVTPTVTGNPDVMVTPASLTFTAADWSRAQTVTVTAADDADGDNETAAVEHRVSGADYGANAVTVPDLPVSVNDNDQTSRSVQLSVDPSVVEEDGGGATVTVTATLDGAARAAATDVALAVTGGTAVAVTDFAAVTGVTVTIPAQQLTGTATFRFSPVNDNLDEGLSETVVLGGSVTGLTVRPATLTIADDDGKGLELSQGPVTLTEEGSATYTVALATQPTGPVTVRVTVSGDRDVTVDPASLSFTPTTWETAQTVTVRAAHDDDPLDDTAELRHAATGADYGGVRALPLAVAVTDNDTRAVTLSESTLSFDEGGSATYTVVLDTRPSGTVRVMPALATGSDADVTVTPSSLSFTATSWSRAQTVTVRAGEDADRVNDGATVEHAVSGADYGENGVTAASLPVTAIDRFSAPDAPTALTATAFGRNRIDLAWTAPPAEAGGRGIAGYHVEVSADRGNTWSVLAADTRTDSTAYQHGGLEFGTTRHYRVSTINRLGTSPASNVASATTDARPVVTFSHRTIPNENGDGSLSPAPRYEVTIAFSQPVSPQSGSLYEQAVLTGGRYFSGPRPIPAANQLSRYYTEWKAEIVPSGPLQGGPVTTTLTIPENALRDRAGRLSRANTLRIESDLPNQDETPPQVIVRPGEAGYALGPFTVDVEFNEPVTGFVQNELRVSNGRVTAWEPLEGGKVYRATVRPDTPSDETIEVTFNIPAGAARDGGGNDSAAAAPLTVPARPRPIVSVTGKAKAGGGGDQEVTVTFSEPVTGFTENELIIQKPTYAENHALSAIGAARVTTFTADENGLEYVFTVRPTRLGYVEMTVRANVANDAEGYPNLATHSYKVINLTAIPQGTQRGLRAEPDPLVAAFRGAPANHDGTGAFALQLAFDGAITGDADDVRDAITVTNGGLTAIARDKKESSQWNLTVTPSSTSDVTVEIAASAPCDEDGALCTADGRRLEASAETTIDGAAPVVTGPSIASARLVTGPGGNGTWDVGERVTGEIIFTAPVTVDGFPTLGLSLDGVRREASYALGSGTATVRFSYPVTGADAGATEARLIANGFDVTNGAIGGLQGQLAVLEFAVAPYVTAVAVLPDDSGDGQWSPGEKIEAQLTFSEPVAVTGGTPSVGVTAGGAAKTAPYASGAGTASLVFAYPVTDADGTVTRAALTADSLALNGAGLSAQATGLAAETGHGGAARTASTARTPSTPVAPDAAPMLSISDARAVEGVDASMTFTVTLAPASSGPVTANYATGGGNATEGQDYTGVFGRLRFAPGETSKTIEVAVLDDDYDEDEETFHLVLYQADGADIADGVGQGTIANTDAMPAAWLARFGRTVSDQVLDAVEARLRASRAAGVTVRLAGQTLGSARQAEADESDGKRPELEADERQKVLSDWLKGETRDGDRSRTLAGREVLMGSSFALAAKTDGGGFASVWGRMAQSRFGGSEEMLRLDGEVTTGLLGVDYAGDPWTGGVVLSHSRGDGDYRGKGSGRTDASLTVLTPWAGYAVSERVSLWGALGYGEGDVTLTPTDQTGQETDIAMTLAATGARGALLQGGGPKLDAVADARWVRTSSERVSSGEGNLKATSADVTRLRLGLEAAWALALGDGATLTPRLALGGRHDGGDAETGFGVDIGGGMALVLPARGLTLSLQGRGLLSHAASGFRDSGFSGHIGWDSKPASEHGLTLSLRQTVGSSASGGGQALFSREVMENLGANDNGSARRLEAKLGYGFPAFGDRFTSTPELGLGLSNGQREISLGWGLNMAGGGSNALELRLEASRHEHANDNADAVHGIGFRLTARW